MPTNPRTEVPELTPKTYTSIQDVFKEDRAFVEELNESLVDSEVTRFLVKTRLNAGLTQTDIAKLLGKTQSAVSKIESGNDENITIDVLQAYSAAFEKPMILVVGGQLNHVDSVKFHANGIYRHLSALADLANQDIELSRGIAKFFGEAFVNLFGILSQCAGKIRAEEVDSEEEDSPVRIFLADEVTSRCERPSADHQAMASC